MPNLNMHFKIKCKDSRKSLKTKKIFVEFHTLALDNEPLCGVYHHRPLPRANLCRVSGTRQKGFLPSSRLCRAKRFFAECRALSRAGLDKDALWRVPDF